PAEPSPDEAPVAEDPAAVAAREAVKATLATIAAAAANAHEEGGHKDEAAADSKADAPAPAELEPEKQVSTKQAPRSRRRKAESAAKSVEAASVEASSTDSEPDVAAPAPELVKEAAPVHTTGVIGGAPEPVEAVGAADPTSTAKAAAAATEEAAP